MFFYFITNPTSFFLFALIIQIYVFSNLKLISIGLGLVSLLLIFIFLFVINKKLLGNNSYLSDDNKKRLGWRWWLFCFFSTHFCFPWVIGLIMIFSPTDEISGIPVLKIILLSISILLINVGLSLRLKKS